MSLDVRAAARRPLSLGIAAAALLVLWALLCWPWFVGGLVIPWDAKNHFYPQLRFLAAALHDGQSVAWAPYVYSGHPQLADPQSLIFSPTMLVLALLDSAPSLGRMDAAILAAVLPGCLGILLIFRRRGWRIEGGLIAALAYAFGGAAAARLQHPSMIFSYGLLPLALWLLMRMLERRSWPGAVWFGIAAATMVIGRDQVAFLGCFVLAGYVIFAWLEAPGRRAYLRSRAVPIVVAVIVGAAILAIPLLLTLEMAAMSNRPTIAYDIAAAGSLTPWSLLTIAIPDYFGTLGGTDDYWGPGAFAWGAYDNHTDRAINYLYIGALPALLCVWHGIAGRRLAAREIRFFVIVFAVAVIYALGHYTPIFRALFEIPGVSLYRRPADAVFLAGFGLAMMGGYLVHRLLAEGPPALSRAAAVALAVGTVVVLVTALVFAAAHDRLGTSARASGWALAFLLVSLGAVLLAARWRHRPMVIAGVLAVVLAADLARHNAGTPFNARDRAEYAELDPAKPNALIADLEKRLAADRASRFRVEIVGLGGPWQNAPLAYGIEATLGYNPLRWADYEKATGAGEGSHMTRRVFTPLFPGYRSAMADLLGMRYIATGVPIETLDPALKSGDLNFVARIGNAYVYENPRALPRVRFATEIAVADSQRLIETGAWPADPRVVAVLDRQPPEWRAVPPGAADGKAATVAIAIYRHDQVVIDVTAAAPGMLVLHDLFHPAWRASLDGEPVAVYRANVLFRAVFVPAGRHTVRFTHHPIASAAKRFIGRGP